MRSYKKSLMIELEKPSATDADLDFAMEAGTHTALEAADVVVTNDDLKRVAEATRLTRRMWMPGAGARLFVVFDGLRLLRTRTGSK